MPSQPIFRFKQFAVELDKCAMKVNTDGVLLGAWADVSQAMRILDIGTGTGVIALMQAQKNTDTTIDAIDIDHNAFIQAGENFINSKWADRLKVYHSSLQDFTSVEEYDTIISNPPYFINDYTSEDAQMNAAKHSTELTYEELANGIDRLLTKDGKVFLILPSFNIASFEPIANSNSLYIVKRTDVIAVTGKKKPYVTMIKLERNPKEYITDTIGIQSVDGSFTDDYRSITKDFYLKF